MRQILKSINSLSVIAPASHTPKTRLQTSVAFAKKHNIKANFSKTIITPDTFFASSLENQFKDLSDAIKSKDNIIWALRGGWGSMRLTPKLIKLKKPVNQKLLIGYSDITALHIFFNQNWNWITLHANNFSNVSKKLLDIIQGKVISLEHKISPFNKLAKKSKPITAKVVGGNLSLVQATIGTKTQLKTNGKILFLEDVGERGYATDRMLEQLLQSGVISNKTKAIVFGQFTGSEESNGKSQTKKAFENLSKKIQIPLYWKLNSGHGKTNNPIFLNLKTKLTSKSFFQDLSGIL